MTLQTILLLMGVGAVVVAAGATACRISPWWIVGVGSLAGAATLMLAAREENGSCGSPTALTGAFELATGLSFTLYAAAALTSVVDGVRLRREGDFEAAGSRFLVCPVARAFGIGAVFFVFLAVIAHCLD
jgi:FtsH-binding integral membrane protein